MDTGSAVQAIKKELESTFGVAIATTLLAMSRTKAQAPLIGMSKQEYLNLVEALCADHKLEQMLGASGAKEKHRKWTALVD